MGVHNSQKAGERMPVGHQYRLHACLSDEQNVGVVVSSKTSQQLCASSCTYMPLYSTNSNQRTELLKFMN